MRKLLSANFSRLWKDKTFWFCMGGMLAFAVVYMLYSSRNPVSRLTGETYPLEHFYFRFALYIGAFSAVFTSMFLGTEYSDGTIRNKLIVGHTRPHVYLAGLAVSMVAGLLFLGAWLVGALVGVAFFGWFSCGSANLAAYLLLSALMMAAYAAVFTLTAMLCDNKANSVLLCVVLYVALLLCASMLYNALKEPEMVYESSVRINGILAGEQIPNPNYVSGARRSLFELLSDILPTGQSANLEFLEIERPLRMMACSAAVTAVLSGLGIALFRRKDLK